MTAEREPVAVTVATTSPRLSFSLRYLGPCAPRPFAQYATPAPTTRRIATTTIDFFISSFVPSGDQNGGARPEPVAFDARTTPSVRTRPGDYFEISWLRKIRSRQAVPRIG